MSKLLLALDPGLHWLASEQHSALLVLDPQGQIIGASPAAETLLKSSEERLCRLGPAGLGIAGDVRFQQLIESPDPLSGASNCQLPITSADGTRWGANITANHQANGNVLLKLDVLSIANAPLSTLREDEERYRLALAAAGIGTWDMDIKRNETRRSLLHDRCFGYRQLQPHWSYETFLSHVVEEDRARVDAAYQRAMDGGDEYDIRFRVRWPDESIHWLWSKGSFYLDEDGSPSRVAGIQADVTQEITLREELRYQATRDYLTGLWNRASFEMELTDLLAKTQGTEQSVAVLLIDIDHFKRFNDAFNHAAGDQVLIALAKRIQSIVGCDAVAARFGSDEFAIALPSVGNDDQADAWFGTLVAHLSQPLTLDHGPVTPTVCAGVAFAPQHGRSAAELLRAADAAMHEAKRCGRATYSIYSPLAVSAEAKALMLADRLPDALANGEIQLFYQPQFELVSRRLSGLEALLRWFPNGEAAIPPDQFIYAAEQSGFISILGDWVIHEACRQVRDWQDRGIATVPVAINVSGVQFLRGHLFDSLTYCLEHYQLPGDAFELEITETIALDNAEIVLEQLQKLNKAGISIAIDDFGTGFSSLSYLRDFPVNRIKVDRSFVAGCVDIQESAAICKTVISLAQNFGCRVIAEGVENHDQLDFLLGQGCQEVQGYLMGRPVDKHATEALLVDQTHQAPPIVGVPQTKPTQPVSDTSSETVRQRAVDLLKQLINNDSPELKRIIQMAAAALNVPMASFNLVDGQQVKAMVTHGFTPTSFDRPESFCGHTIRQADLLEIPDTRQHPLFQNDPLVCDEPGIRFYAGLGILSPDHQPVGTLCLLDIRPRALAPVDRDMVLNLGAMVEKELLQLLTAKQMPVFRSGTKREFGLKLKQSWRVSAKTDAPLAMIWVGTDNLKQINGALGYDVGDRCVKFVQAAIAILNEEHRYSVYRMEGDTVALICENTTAGVAVRFAQTLRQYIEEMNYIQGPQPELALTVSVGVHGARSSGTSAGLEQFLSRARHALSTAKSGGKNQVQVIKGLASGHTKSESGQPAP